jgi:hypothetical protein
MGKSLPESKATRPKKVGDVCEWTQAHPLAESYGSLVYLILSISNDCCQLVLLSNTTSINSAIFNKDPYGLQAIIISEAKVIACL